MHGLRVEITRFTIVGGLNFVLTFAVFFVLLEVVHTHHLVALAAAWLLGTLFSYSLNYLWVFRPEERLAFRSRFVKYTAAGVASLLMNLAALQVVVAHFHADPFWAQCALMPFVVAFNFLTAKFWSLSPSAKVPQAPMP